VDPALQTLGHRAELAVADAVGDRHAALQVRKGAVELRGVDPVEGQEPVHGGEPSPRGGFVENLHRPLAIVHRLAGRAGRRADQRQRVEGPPDLLAVSGALAVGQRRRGGESGLGVIAQVEPGHREPVMIFAGQRGIGDASLPERVRLQNVETLVVTAGGGQHEGAAERHLEVPVVPR